MSLSAASPPNVLPPAGFDAARLIDTYQVGIWRYLRTLGCEPHLADDLTQETFLTILRKGTFQHFDPAATAGYLRTVAHNLFVSHHRRTGRVVPVADPAALTDAWVTWVHDDSGDELLAHLKDCLQQLTARARQALELRYREDESRANIAASLDITEHGARNLMQRAKQQLRTCIEGKMQ